MKNLYKKYQVMATLPVKPSKKYDFEDEIEWCENIIARSQAHALKQMRELFPKAKRVWVWGDPEIVVVRL
jgi:hypothetical protein